MRALGIAILVALALALGTGAGVAFTLWQQGKHEEGQPVPDDGRAYAPVEGKEARELAERFRPLLMFDGEEPWRPQSIGSLLAERQRDGRPLHALCSRSQSRDTCDPVASIAELERLIAEKGALGDSTYLDISGKSLGEYRAPRRSAGCRSRELMDCDDHSGSAIYYNVTWSNDRFYIDYWWFLRFNHFAQTERVCPIRLFCGEHEGDWEGVTLVTQPDDDQRLDYVVYAMHNHTFRYPAKELLGAGGRPEVFVANGSHASYPEACARHCKQRITYKGLAYLPEERADGTESWVRNRDDCGPGATESCLLPLPVSEQGLPTWTTWPGLWGASCGSCRADRPNGPKSPGLQPRFRTPWCTTQAGCDSTPPGCGEWLGPLVAALACNPGAVARGLAAPEELPSGGLKMTVRTGDGRATPIRATTRGIVQALGPPLRPGDQLAIADAGASTEILLRVGLGRRLLEARFDPFTRAVSGKTLEVSIGERKGIPVVVAKRGDGSRVPAVEKRRIRLPQG